MVINIGFLAKDDGITLNTAVKYWIAQVIGGIVGSLIGYATVGKVNAPNLAFEVSNSDYCRILNS